MKIISRPNEADPDNVSMDFEDKVIRDLKRSGEDALFNARLMKKGAFLFGLLTVGAILKAFIDAQVNGGIPIFSFFALVLRHLSGRAYYESKVHILAAEKRIETRKSRP